MKRTKGFACLFKKAPLLMVLVFLAILLNTTILSHGAGEDNQRVDWSIYMDYATVTKNIKDWVSENTSIAQLESIGKSYEGRDMWLVTITNRSTGSPEVKPILYVQGGIDSDEVITVQAAMFLLRRVLNAYGNDPIITRLVDTHTLFIAPNVIPDQSEVFHHSPKRPRDSTIRPYDNDFDRLVDEDDMEDIDGDGRINEDPVGGVDPNRNWPAHWIQEYQQSWAGLYPMSEVENQNLIRFVLAHSNIGTIVDLHSSGNLLYRLSSVYTDDEMNIVDLTFFKSLSRRYTELTDGPVITPLQGVRARGGRGVYGSGIFIDWAYDHLGVFSFAPELWAFPVNKNSLENRDATESERIEWAIANFGDGAWIDWKPFNHPQLGKIELGGWHKPMPNNPMKEHVERITSEITEWMIFLWSQLPRVEVTGTDVDHVDGQTYRVSISVANTGFLPTNITERALTVRSALPVFLAAETDKDVRIVGWGGSPKGPRAGSQGIILGHLGGWGSSRMDAPNKVTVDLLVKDERQNKSSPAKLLVIIDGQRAGTLRQAINLEVK